MSGSRALEALTAGLVDYAGLFPPAALAMPDAVRAYARHAAGPDRAMLARFVVPFGRLAEFAVAVDALGADGPTPAAAWRLSVLATALDAPALAAWEQGHEGRFAVDAVEAKAETADAIASLAAAFGGAAGVFVEIPIREDPLPLVAALKAHGLRAKVRTGGLTADAFPPPTDIVRFLRCCHEARVPFKATAGLHHPLRGEYPFTYAADAVRGTMYGFVNLFLCAALLHGGADDATVVALLVERDARAFTLHGSAITWRGRTIPADLIATARAEFAGSFGSCSFDEPARELPQLLQA